MGVHACVFPPMGAHRLTHACAVVIYRSVCPWSLESLDKPCVVLVSLIIDVIILILLHYTDISYCTHSHPPIIISINKQNISLGSE